MAIKRIWFFDAPSGSVGESQRFQLGVGVSSAIEAIVSKSGSDTLSISVTDALSVLRVLNSVSDSLSITTSEASALSSLTYKTAADVLSLALSESTGTINVLLSRTDTLGVSILETVASYLHVGAVDAIEINLGESSVAYAVLYKSGTDTLFLGVYEQSELNKYISDYTVVRVLRRIDAEPQTLIAFECAPRNFDTIKAAKRTVSEEIE